MTTDARALRQKTSRKKTTDEWTPFEVTVHTRRAAFLERSVETHGPDPSGESALLWSEEVPPDCMQVLRLRLPTEPSAHQAAALEQAASDEEYRRFFQNVTIDEQPDEVERGTTYLVGRVMGLCRAGQMTNARWDLLKWQFRIDFIKADGTFEHEDIWWPNVYFKPPFINRPKGVKRKWRIEATRQLHATIEVEASSAEVAMKLARSSPDLWKDAEWSGEKMRDWHFSDEGPADD